MRLSLGVLVSLFAANCAAPGKVSGGRHASEVKYGVASSPRVIADGQPVPKGGGRDMVGQPYVVAGRTYVPHPGRGYRREGWASWYGSAFHGRLTANGEIFDRDSVAAAHPTLPLPSYVRVTNVANGRSMIVRVNDRGPYERDRVIDVSEKVAFALDFHRKGTGRVRVEYVGKASITGSDDEKLMATLRMDGRPAVYRDRDSAIQVAEALPPRRERDGAPARIENGASAFQAAARASGPGPRALPEYLDPPRAEKGRDIGRSAVATAEDVRRQPLDIRPPSRPDFGGVY